MTEGGRSIARTAPWLVLAAMLFSTLPARGQQVGFSDAATVFDTTSKRIGSLHDPSSVFLKLGDNTLLAVRVGKDGFVGNGLAYSSADCSGTPYDQGFGGREDGIPLLAPKALLGPPGSTVYVRQANATATSITVMSFLSNGRCEGGGFGEEDVFPVVPLVDLNAQFTPPFRAVPSSTSSAQTCGDCNEDGAVTANEITQVISNVFNERVGSK